MSRVVFQIAILCALTLIAGAATAMFHPRAPGWRLTTDMNSAPDEYRVSAAEIDERWGGNVLWVDARTRDKFDAAHVEGALWVGDNVLNTLTVETTENLWSERRPIVVYCDGARCEKGKLVAGELRDLLAREVFYLEDGWAPPR